MAAKTRRFRRADRVLAPREYRDVARCGRRSSGPAFILLWCADNDASRSRLGLTVSRKVGNAVMRNHIKRRVREWFRHDGRTSLSGGALVVIARRGARGLASDSLARELDRQVHEVTV